jgi:3-oxoacyl-[acyl-carrier-protein] synthase II
MKIENPKMPKIEMAITGVGVISALGNSPATIARKLLRGESGIGKFSFRPSSTKFVAARVRPAIKTVTPDRWPISRTTALGLKATQAVMPHNGVPLPAEPRLGLIHATAYGNLESLFSYQSDLRKFGLRRASPMQFPNTILHAAASFLSIGVGATAFNITLSNENLSGVDALETATQLLEMDTADRVLVVTSEDVSAELIPMLETYDEIDWKAPDPFGEKRAGYAPGEAAVAVLIERTQQAQAAGKRVYARLRGSSGISHRPHGNGSYEATMRSALADAGLQAADVGCVFASANGSRHDGEEANAIAAVFGEHVPVTSIKGAVGECGAASSLLNIAAAIYCGEKGYHPPTLGRSRYDRRLAPINVLRNKEKMKSPVFVVNAFNKSARCSQVWQLPSPGKRVRA